MHAYLVTSRVNRIGGGWIHILPQEFCDTSVLSFQDLLCLFFQLGRQNDKEPEMHPLACSPKAHKSPGIPSGSPVWEVEPKFPAVFPCTAAGRHSASRSALGAAVWRCRHCQRHPHPLRHNSAPGPCFWQLSKDSEWMRRKVSRKKSSCLWTGCPDEQINFLWRKKESYKLMQPWKDDLQMPWSCV